MDLVFWIRPKPYILKVEPPEEIKIASIGVDASISKAAQYLWDLDINRLSPGKDYVVNVQRGKKSYQKYDTAPDPLFSRVDKEVFKRPTYRAFIALLDNYNAKTGVAEVVTNSERREVSSFLRVVMQTAPMQFCHKYCLANCDNIPREKDGFMKLLQKIWFDLYNRSHGGRADSSGFEHVFVGELKKGNVSEG